MVASNPSIAARSGRRSRTLFLSNPQCWLLGLGLVFVLLNDAPWGSLCTAVGGLSLIAVMLQVSCYAIFKILFICILRISLPRSKPLREFVLRQSEVRHHDHCHVNIILLFWYFQEFKSKRSGHDSHSTFIGTLKANVWLLAIVEKICFILIDISYF